MTEYWVSQGNKWCDFCKIYIANNPASIRTHEFGQRHKDNVAKKLTTIRKENAAKEKEKQQALKDLDRIEAQARRSYEKDLVAKKRLESSAVLATTTGQGSASGSPNPSGEWSYTEESGYFFNAATGYYYDPNSGLYFAEIHGKWVTQEEAFKASAGSQMKLPPLGPNARASGQGIPASQAKIVSRKGVPSSLEVGKRKRAHKAESTSKEERAALAAREAAKKRVQEREKGFMGLYQSH